ncbi:MAG TPA: hypothetical protein VL068_03625, partial [Microthrixaceae bacterium]|nr:hypothetical protein [Microthrixaceae bacterium]
RWVALTRTGAGRRREGILIVAEQTAKEGRPGFAVRRHGDAELWSATHSHELVSAGDEDGSATYLYLDIAQRGIGTGSCGPDALSEYQIPAGRHQLRAWFCAFDPRTEDPGELARSLR